NTAAATARGTAHTDRGGDVLLVARRRRQVHRRRQRHGVLVPVQRQRLRGVGERVHQGRSVLAQAAADRAGESQGAGGGCGVVGDGHGQRVGRTRRVEVDGTGCRRLVSENVDL